MVKEALLPVRGFDGGLAKSFRQGIFQGLCPGRKRDFSVVQGDEGVEVVRHEDVRAEPCAMIGPEFREALEGFVNRRLGEDLCAVMGIGRHKVDRIPLESHSRRRKRSR